MTLYFITGNKNKFKEINSIIPQCKQLNIDLIEIQELDARIIIEEKLNEALKKQTGELFCEDTSLYIKALNDFPGPLIKWYAKSLSIKGIYEQIKNYNNKKAFAKTIIGYTNGNEIKFFEGMIEGEIVEPQGENGFGWDSIFKPKGYNKTFAQMNNEEKNKISMR